MSPWWELMSLYAKEKKPMNKSNLFIHKNINFYMII